MKQKIKKEALSEKVTVRFSTEELEAVSAKAYELGMGCSTYIHDRIVKGKDRSTYAKRKMCQTLITVNNSLDHLYNTVESLETDSVNKDDLLLLLDTMRKECSMR